MNDHTSSSYPWALDDIPYNQIDFDRIRGQERLFFLVTAASFVEIAADLYTLNLVSYYQDDAVVCRWLRDHWAHEEVLHGHALKAYVQQVWPEFDWEESFHAFFAEYSQSCTVDEFEPTLALEMAARCVVETGTTAYYQTLHDLTDEPVLRMLTLRIRNDEIGHFKHFYQYFRKYQADEKIGRFRVFTALVRRLLETRNSDAECAVRNIFLTRYPDKLADLSQYRQLFRDLGKFVSHRYPAMMAVKMFMKPLMLPQFTQVFYRPLAKATQYLLLG